MKTQNKVVKKMKCNINSKNQTNYKNTFKIKSKLSSKLGWFKIAAIVLMVLFILIVAGGLFKMHQFRSSFVELDQTQINSAKSVAIEDLVARGKNVSDYEIKVMPRAKMIDSGNHKVQETKSGAGSVVGSVVGVEVSFFKSKEIQFYLIDIDSKQIMMHSETNFYTENCLGFKPPMPPMGKLEQKNLEGSRWFHGGLFN